MNLGAQVSYGRTTTMIQLVAPGEQRADWVRGLNFTLESGDWLAKARPLTLAPGDLLAFASAGAYGSAMGSQYNSRLRPPEVLVRADGRIQLLRRRDRFEDLILTEQIPDDL